MAKPILADDLWAVIAPLLPVHRPSARGGRPRIPDRAALTGILFVLKTGIQWEDLPPETGCGCKHHLLVDQRGLPLVAQLSPANRDD